MESSEQTKTLLKAKIAVALHDELGRVTKEKDIEPVSPIAAEQGGVMAEAPPNERTDVHQYRHGVDRYQAWCDMIPCVKRNALRGDSQEPSRNLALSHLSS